MTLNLKLVLKAGLVWGIVGIVLAVGATLLGSLKVLDINGIALGTYAAMFGGVHFVARNEGKNIVEDLIGGAVSGVVVAVLLIIVGVVLPLINRNLAMSLSPADIAGALLAGVAGAIGMIVITPR